MEREARMRKAPTLRDIARMAGVSVATVSKSLRNHPDISAVRRNEILALARKIRYVPNGTASNLRRQRTNLICMIISDNTNPYYASVLRGVEEQASLQGFLTIIFNSNEDPDRESQFILEMQRMKVAGAIITPALGNRKSIRMLEEFGIPFVMSSRYIDRDKNCYVVADDIEAGYIAARYLLQKNKGNAMTYFLSPKNAVSSVKDRYAGFQKAMEEKGLEKHSKRIETSGFKQEDGYHATKQLLRSDRPPFSIVCYSDFIASGVCKALIEEGVRIPDDVRVVGIDNDEVFSFMHPSLTTVNIPKEKIGSQSALLLFDLIQNREQDGSGRQARIRVKPELVIRESA